MGVDPSVVTPLVEAAGLGLAAAFVCCGRQGAWREYTVVALAGWLGEESSMLLYGYYGYAPEWVVWLHETPLAVVAIWPMVVLTSLAIARRAGPLPRVGLAFLTAGLVIYDTLVMEPVATRLGLWWWRDGSYFGVPALGVVGWGIFAAAAALVLSLRRPIRSWDLLWRPVVIAVFTQAILAPLAFASLHLEIALPVSESGYAWGIAALGVLLLAVAWRLRKRLDLRFGHIAFKVAGAALFFTLLYGFWLEPFVGFCSLLPLPYLVLTLGRRRRGEEAPSWPSR
jgi:hypothetical protein